MYIIYFQSSIGTHISSIFFDFAELVNSVVFLKHVGFIILGLTILELNLKGISNQLCLAFC
jgi:hypothetical protein